MSSQVIRANRRLIVRVVAAVFLAAAAIRLAYVVMPAGAAPWGGSVGLPETGPAGTDPFVRHAVIISVDGLRPDLLLRARTPNLHALMNRGAFTMWARTTEMSITLPSHTSMVTGVTPEHHRLVWNYYVENVYPDTPTIFELAHRAGYSTALFSGKAKFNELCRPGSVDWVGVFRETATRKVGYDIDVAIESASVLRRQRPDVLFMHLGQVDETGHGIGWATPEQVTAIERADAAIGILFDALRELDLLDSTLIIVSADHGGQGKTHGPNDPRSRHIPWIVSGPGIKRGFDLTRHADLVVNTEDTFATACTLLRLKVPANTDGKFVKQILAQPLPEPAPKKDEPTKPDPDAYNRWEAPKYKPEWERLDPSHR